MWTEKTLISYSSIPNSEYCIYQFYVLDKCVVQLVKCFQELGISVTHYNTEVVCGSDVVFVAVKPHMIPRVLIEVSQHITKKQIIVSVAAGVTLAMLEEVRATAAVTGFHSTGFICLGIKYLESFLVFCFHLKLLPENSIVIRLMPNLPCLVQEGALLFALGTNAKGEDGALLLSLLHCCGLVEEVPETWIDVHTGLSGSGVAFVSLCCHIYTLWIIQIFTQAFANVPQLTLPA